MIGSLPGAGGHPYQESCEPPPGTDEREISRQRSDVRIIWLRRFQVRFQEVDRVYCTIQDVPAPIEIYDRVHAAVGARVGDGDIGLLMHLAKASSGGFTVIEIWRSKADFD